MYTLGTMYHPTTRVLTVLELLQSHGQMTGAALAERLEVNIRTLRRYITMLQDLGVPILAERGRYGAYQLGAGYKLPPMMFTNDEAIALALGLLAAQQLGLAETGQAVESARAKLERVMPAELKSRMRALSETVRLDLGTNPERLPGPAMLTLSGAAKARQRVRLRYRSGAGDETERDFEPYGLAHRNDNWYVVGRCDLRDDLRSFRLDRILQVDLTDAHFERPADFDALAFVVRSIASLPRQFPFEILLETDLEEAERVLSDVLGLLEPVEAGIILRGRTDNLDWLARQLARFPFPFVVRGPDALRTALRRRATELVELADRREPPGLRPDAG
jgi:predicted DNA-binding transcriptional regulator YafY